MDISHCFIFCILIILIICGDTELNPGPKKDNSCDKLSLCLWNLNNITAYKLSLHLAYNPHHMYDTIYLSETHLNSSVPYGDLRLILSG